jgi:hypothetical protein
MKVVIKEAYLGCSISWFLWITLTTGASPNIVQINCGRPLLNTDFGITFTRHGTGQSHGTRCAGRIPCNGVDEATIIDSLGVGSIKKVITCGNW